MYVCKESCYNTNICFLHGCCRYEKEGKSAFSNEVGARITERLQWVSQMTDSAENNHLQLTIDEAFMVKNDEAASRVETDSYAVTSSSGKVCNQSSFMSSSVLHCAIAFVLGGVVAVNLPMLRHSLALQFRK